MKDGAHLERNAELEAQESRARGEERRERGRVDVVQRQRTEATSDDREELVDLRARRVDVRQAQLPQLGRRCRRLVEELELERRREVDLRIDLEATQ